MQLPEEHRRDTGEVVDAGFGRGHAQRHEDDITELHEQRQAEDSTAARGREAHFARAEILEGRFRVFGSRRSEKGMYM